MMSFLHKTLAVALFALLTAVLFAVLMGPVLFGLATYYGHWSFNPPTGLLLAISEIITLGVSTALAAGVFLIVGLMTKRR
jgi:hypothetical protein